MAKKTETNKTWILVSLIIGAAILGYGLINYKYKMTALEYDLAEKQKILEHNEAEKQNKALNFNHCINSVRQAYVTNWNDACKDIGQADECLLPTYRADSIEEREKLGTDNCIRLYGN